MTPTGTTPRPAEQTRRSASGQRYSSAANLAHHAALGTLLLAGLLLFYGSAYSVHQDLAGSALSGQLAVTLGDAFGEYSLYFPPAERAWFSAAAWLAGATGLRLDLVVVLMTGAAVLFAGGLAYWIRRDTVGASPLFLVLPVALLTILPILFKNVFGLREHLVVLGLWPYLVLRVSDPEGTLIGWRVRLLLGLWIGATLLFKYFYSVVILLAEFTDAVVQRRPRLLLRIENVAAGAVVALYLFCWLVLDPSQRTVIGAMLSAIDAHLADPRANWLQAGNAVVLAIFLLLASRMFRLPRRQTALGLALVVGAVAAAWVQERWFSHHMFPITMAYVAWWWMTSHGLRWWGHALVAAYLSVSVVSQLLQTKPYQQDVRELDTALHQAGQSVSGKRVGILTMHPSPYNQYLASHDGLRWNALMNTAYVAAELRPYDEEGKAALPPPVRLADPGRRMLHDEMLRLWEDMPPDVLILDHSTRWPLRFIDVRWRHVFSADPRFDAIVGRYRPVLAHKGERLEFEYLVRVR